LLLAADADAWHPPSGAPLAHLVRDTRRTRNKGKDVMSTRRLSLWPCVSTAPFVTAPAAASAATVILVD
jgi:hypothetical protein